MAEGDNPLFQDFGNPEDYELTDGFLLPTTNTNFTIHPQYTQMVFKEQFSIENIDSFLGL